MEFIGWLGSIFFAICGAPEAWRSYKNKRCDVGWGFLALWLLGEVLTLAYVVWKGGTELLPLIFNYTGNIAFILVMVYYKVRGKNET